ncbi:MAG: NifX-associated nitrogen fixation protein [Frankia sp.]|nr:NifX-associated nitrogen fixation protein [Frankia sp.]
MSAQLSSFLRDLVDQQRAGDTYGQLDRVSDENMLRPFVVTRAETREIPVACDVEAATEGRVRAFYQAVAAGIEKATGAYTTAVLDLSHEGFGWAIVFAGRLVVVSDVLRDAQRFGFPSLEALAERGESLVAAGAKAVSSYPEVANDDS